jgi:hypothetical protein
MNTPAVPEIRVQINFAHASALSLMFVRWCLDPFVLEKGGRMELENYLFGM